MYYPFSILWIPLADSLMFCLEFLRFVREGSFSLVFFFCDVLVSGNAGFMEWFGECSFLFNFWEQFVHNWDYFFLKCSVGFTSEALWTWNFLLWRFLALCQNMWMDVLYAGWTLCFISCTSFGQIYLCKVFHVSFFALLMSVDSRLDVENLCLFSCSVWVEVLEKQRLVSLIFL